MDSMKDSFMKSMQNRFKTCAQMIDEEGEVIQQQKLKEQVQKNFEPGFQSSQNYTCPQVIYPSEIENKLFQLITDNINKDTQSHIFVRIGESWVNQFKLSLSMKRAGWVHFHVMDCMCKMLEFNQDLVSHVQGHIYQQYFQYMAIEVLKQTTIDFSSFNYNFLDAVGFKIEKASILHIPCFIENQWVLIVVNFSEKLFVILDPALDTHATGRDRVVDNVIKNFKTFFHICCPDSIHNVIEFLVTQPNVPKYKSSNDSGIFVIQFMQTFNGSTVADFSHVDVIPLRARFLYQLTFTVHNEVNDDFIDSFYHAYPHLFANLK